MLLDNATYHPVSSISHVRLLFIPSNTTSHLSAIKPTNNSEFYTFFIRKEFFHLLCPIWMTAFPLAKKIIAHNAVYWIKTAWTEVAGTTIKKCFINMVFKLATQICTRNHYIKFCKKLHTLATAAGLQYEENEDSPILWWSQGQLEGLTCGRYKGRA